MSEENEAVVQHLSVNPKEASWPPVLQYRQQWKFRVFFKKHPAAMANALHLGDLRYFLEDNCGQEEVHWLTEGCDEPKIHTVQGEDKEAMLRGNAVYLTDMGWLLSLKLQTGEDESSPWDIITIVETRNDI